MGVERRSQKKSSVSNPSSSKGGGKRRKKEVSSKIENTAPATITQNGERNKMSTSLHKYRSGIKEKGEDLAEEVVKRMENNLLNAKLVLWTALQVVEKKIRERKN